jgi:hypothetical protein
VAIAFWLAMASQAGAGVVVEWRTEDGGNGHFYELVDQRVTWPMAKAAAESMSFMGLPGHLATITSAAENEFIATNVLAGDAIDIGAWIGLTDDENFGGSESFGQPNRMVDGWHWVTGEPVSFTAWNSFSAEPNNGVPNHSGDEDWAILFFWRGDAVWNDQTAFYAPPFIVEYEPAQAAVPEPASLLIWAALGLVVGGYRLASFRRGCDGTRRTAQ